VWVGELEEEEVEDGRSAEDPALEEPSYLC
jgi:hypothetical protein